MFNTAGLQFVKHVFTYIKLLREFKPDVVHFHFGFCYPVYAPIALMFGAKATFKTMHCNLSRDNEMYLVQDKKELPLEKRAFYIWGHALQCVSEVVYVSKCSQRQFQTYITKNNKGEVIYLGVPDAKSVSDEDKSLLRRQLNIPTDAFVICNTSFATRWKSVDTIISALPYLKHQNCVQLILGWDEDIPLTAEMHTLARTLGVEEKIRWIGITNEVYKYLSISDIYVQPSRTEALGLAVCEAMSYGLPCVGSNAGGLPEVCNVLFETGNSRELAEKLDTLMADPALRAKLGSESKKAFEEKFKLQRGVEAYHRLYAETLAKKRKKKKA